MVGSLDRVAWEPSETAWAKLLAQLVVFKEESRDCTAVPQRLGKRIQQKHRLLYVVVFDSLL